MNSYFETNLISWITKQLSYWQYGAIASVKPMYTHMGHQALVWKISFIVTKCRDMTI